MKKTIVTLLASGIFASSAAFATVASFSFTVDVQNVSSELSVTESSPITFPTIIVDESTENGNKCYTDSNTGTSSGIPANELCRASTPNSATRNNGVYAIGGTALAVVNMVLSGPTTVNGLTFRPSTLDDRPTTTRSITLNSGGTTSEPVYGLLELTDRTLVISQSTVFTFDITVNYG